MSRYISILCMLFGLLMMGTACSKDDDKDSIAVDEVEGAERGGFR